MGIWTNAIDLLTALQYPGTTIEEDNEFFPRLWQWRGEAYEYLACVDRNVFDWMVKADLLYPVHVYDTRTYWQTAIEG